MKVNSISNSIYFQGGLKKNLRQGERVLREFKSEYPYLKSNTFWQTRLDNMKYKKGANYTKYQYIIDDYADKVRDSRRNINNSENRLETIRQEIAGTKCGNCGEAIEMISEILDSKGIEHKECGFRIIKGRSMGSDHVFTVIGMDEKGDITDPSTWGNKAVIVDGWMNFVLSAPDAIREYAKFFDAKYRRKPLYSDLEFRPICLA